MLRLGRYTCTHDRAKRPTPPWLVLVRSSQRQLSVNDKFEIISHTFIKGARGRIIQKISVTEHNICGPNPLISSCSDQSSIIGTNPVF